RRFERVLAVESSGISAADLRSIAPKNVKVSSQTVQTYLATEASKLRPDLIVVDPPRAGLERTVSRALAKLHPQEAVYVSCDPATLARDLRELTSNGYEITQMHLLDLFPQTFHIETCTVLRR